MEVDVELLSSPLSMEIALHYGKYPDARHWPRYDYPGLQYPSQADIIKAFVDHGFLQETGHQIASPLKPKYEATQLLRDLVQDLLDGYRSLLFYEVTNEHG